MKKYIIICSIISMLLFPNMAYSQQKTTLERTICVAIPFGLSIWGYQQKSGYGTTTGVIFSLRALIELFSDK